jgi:hypothetical protein
MKRVNSFDDIKKFMIKPENKEKRKNHKSKGGNVKDKDKESLKLK